MRIRGTTHGASVAHARCPALHYPIVPLTLQNVAHVEPRAGRTGVLRLKVNRSIGLVLTERDLRHRHVHTGQVGAFGEVIQDALAHGIFCLDVLFAGRQKQSCD